MDKKKPPTRNANLRKGDKVSGRKGIGNPDNKIDMKTMDAYVIERLRADLKKRGLALYEDGSIGPGPDTPDEYINPRKYVG